MARCQKEDELEISEWVAVVSVVIAVASLAVHLRLNLKQSRANALIQIYANNRDLLSMGFDHPQLLKVLSNGQEEDFSRRYLQMWVNHMSLLFQLQKQGSLTREQWQAFELDIRDLMQIPAMETHWQPRGEFYPADFRNFIDGVLVQINEQKKAEAPLPETSA